MSNIFSFNFNMTYHNLNAIIKNLGIINNRYCIDTLLKTSKNRAIYIVNDLHENKRKILKFILQSYVSDELLNIYTFFMLNSNKSFVKINDIFYYDMFIIIEMDYIDGKNMFDYFMNTSNRIHYYNILFDIVFGLNYLHNNNIVHGDIKPHNIIIDSNNKPFILDYDLCRYTNKKYNNLSKPFGTKLYMSPELVEDNIFANNTDMWSLGMSFIICILCKCKYIDQSMENIIKNNDIDTNIPIHLINIFNNNKEYLISVFGKLLINSVCIMTIRNYMERISSDKLTDILKQSSYYLKLYTRNINFVKANNHSNTSIVCKISS